MLPADRAAQICIEFDAVAVLRSTFDNHWQEVAERVLPTQMDTFQYGSDFTPGRRNTERQFDSTAAIALERFQAIMTSLLTPTSGQPWHTIKPSDDNLLRDRASRLWFEKTNMTLWRQRRRPSANFAGQNVQVYESLGAFGTGTLFIDALRDGPGLRYRFCPLGETYFTENHQGQIDTCYRRFRRTVQQILDQFPDSAPQFIKDDAKDPKKAQTEYYLIHCVKPRTQYDPRRIDGMGMKWGSYYVLAEKEKTLLREGGYRTFPYAVGRYKQSQREVYGRSPAMTVLPAIKVLNVEKQVMLKQGHRTVDPIYLVHDDGIIDNFNATPGSMIAGGMSEEGRRLVDTLPTGNLAIGKELMDDERQVINDAFLVTLFQILVETPTMTATEVLERTREKGILLAPTVGRQESEYLGPMNERELDVLAAQGLLDPLPPALVEAQGEYTLEYDNPMARMARASEGSGVQRTIESALAVANATGNPEPLDHFDFDVIVPDLAAINGVPERWMRDKNRIAVIREGRNQAAEQQQMIQAAPGAAAIMSSTAKLRQAGG